jgi:hypothetical protein
MGSTKIHSVVIEHDNKLIFIMLENKINLIENRIILLKNDKH